MADDFFYNDAATTEIYTLSLHDAIPISVQVPLHLLNALETAYFERLVPGDREEHTSELQSLLWSPYAVFCLKKKKEI